MPDAPSDDPPAPGRSGSRDGLRDGLRDRPGDEPSDRPDDDPADGTRDRRAALVLDGRWEAARADDELRRRFVEPEVTGATWVPIEVPSHWRTTPALGPGSGSVLHRRHFELAHADEPPGTRHWLVLDGIFTTSDVWLDGAYLGDTEGWFFPHTFEITDLCQQRDDHLLALDVTCRAEDDRAHKRNLTGAFQHSAVIPAGLDPGGIWRPVRIERSGPVRITHLRALCRDATDETATVFLRAVLDAPDSLPVQVVTTLVPRGPDGRPEAGAGIEHRQTRTLAQGENRVEWTVAVTDPRRWWPHALGDPDRYELRVEVHLDDEPELGPSDARQRTIGLRSVAFDDWIVSINGERLLLKGTNLAPADADLAGADPHVFARDVQAAVDAHLDLLRVHAHVSRPELYEAADAAGMLLWQDMPLQWGYHRSVRRQARRQARELVDLLGHHPSIALWCGHHEPMAIDFGRGTWASGRMPAATRTRVAVAQELPSWNKTVLDRAVRSVLEKCDGTRPVIAHAGVLPHPVTFTGTDSPLSFGWYHGDERDLADALRRWPRLARFVSATGVQSVPDDDAFARPERWPDLDWDELERDHLLQHAVLERHVPTAPHASLAAWRDATQQHQAVVVRRQVETLRRLKYAPTGGFLHSFLRDPVPAIGWSLLDHEGRPKPAYAAMADACAPVAVIADRLPAIVPPGHDVTIAIHVVNDGRIARRDMIVRAHLRSGTASGGADGTSTWRWQGEVPADDCVLVGSIRATAPTTPGRWVLELELRDASGVVATNRDETIVVAGTRPR